MQPSLGVRTPTNAVRQGRQPRLGQSPAESYSELSQRRACIYRGVSGDSTTDQLGYPNIELPLPVLVKETQGQMQRRQELKDS